MSNSFRPLGNPVSALGLTGLPREAVLASNAAFSIVRCTKAVWSTLSLEFNADSGSGVGRKVALHQLNTLQLCIRPWRAHIEGCCEELTRARHLKPALADDLVAENAHLLAVAYYENLDCDLQGAAIVAGLWTGKRVPPEILVENWELIAKVVGGLQVGDVISIEPDGRNPAEHLVWLFAFKEAVARIDAHEKAGEEIVVLIRQEIIEANPPAKAGDGGAKRIPRAEAEILVRDWLKTHAKENPASIKRDAVATGTGVSTGMVSKTAAWKAFCERRDAKKKPGERTVPLSDTMQAMIPADCARPDQIAELIEEQEAEEAEQQRHYKHRHKPS